MDFFEAQDHAQSRSKFLVLYFFCAVLLIIAAVYFAVTGGVFYYQHKLGTGASPPLFTGLRLSLTAGIVVPLICFGSLWRTSQLRSKGGAGVAQSLGGRKVSYTTQRPDERMLRNVVEEMAIASGLPVPGVYVMDHETGINAFAAGFGLSDAVIGVTKGAIEQLDRDELQGVIAHEFSHILNGDMRLNTKLSGWVFGIVMLTMLGRGFWRFIGGGSKSRSGSGRGIYFGRSRGSGGGGGDSKGGAGALIIAVILVAVLITMVGFIGEFFARLIQAAVSRQREYLADASALQFTRNPAGIGNALRRIGGIHHDSVLQNPNASEFAHAFFAKSLTSEVSFLATHPPLKKRIARLLKDWQGDYLKPRPPLKKQADAKKKPKRKPTTFGDAIGGLGAESTDGAQGATSDNFQQMLTAGLFMQCLGQLKQNSQAYAEQIREKLEADWPDVLEQVDRSPGFLLALLFHKDDSIAQKQMVQLKEVFPDRVNRVEDYGRKLRTIGRSERLRLLEILAPRLPEALIEAEYEDYLTCVEAFVEIDQQVLPFEMACLQIVRRQLLKESAYAPTRQSQAEITGAARILCSRLLAETELLGQDAAQILKSASQQAPYFINQLEAVENVDSTAIESAFAILARTPYRIRKQFLQSCERIVAADEKASINEVELLRAIAIGIGVPAAPILPNA